MGQGKSNRGFNLVKPITVVIISTINEKLVKFAVEKTLENCPHVEDVIHFGSKRLIDYGVFIPIKELTYFDYNHLLLKSCYQFVKTDFMLHIQQDAMAIDKTLWTDEFLNYDYIGAPWLDGRVGNGGFSLRSAKLLDACRDHHIKMPYVIEEKQHINEDAVICKYEREYLEVFHKISFAPFDIANRFSREMRDYENKTFGFHGTWNFPLYFSKEEIEEMMDDYYSHNINRKVTWDNYIKEVYRVGFDQAFKNLKNGENNGTFY